MPATVLVVLQVLGFLLAGVCVLAIVAALQAHQRRLERLEAEITRLRPYLLRSDAPR